MNKLSNILYNYLTKGMLYVLFLMCIDAHASGDNYLDTLRLSPKQKSEKGFNAFYSDMTNWAFDDSIDHQYLAINVLGLKAFEGKIIRHINIDRLNFNEDFHGENQFLPSKNDSLNAEEIKQTMLDLLQKKTKERVVRKNLVFQEGDLFNPFLIADNERYMRTLPYLKDVRVTPVPVGDDSIDIVVQTKDLFSIVPGSGGVSPHRQKFSIKDVNLFGSGAMFGLTGLHDDRRDPAFAGDGYFGLNNIAGKFINLDFDFSKMGRNIYNRREDQLTSILNISKPLVTQYTRWAGGVSLGMGKSLNRYQYYYPGEFYEYNHAFGNVWAGINLGGFKYSKDKSYHLKKFLSIGYTYNKFYKSPDQIDSNEFDQRFNTQQSLLVKLTLFKQYYYKTNYIYGFGLTEDVPKGFNVSFTGGWYRQLSLSRPYLGLDATVYSLTRTGMIYQHFIRFGTFNKLSTGAFQDNALMIGTSMFRRLITYKKLKIRQFMRFSYSHIFNRVALDPNRIDNVFGVRAFNSDSAVGNIRLSFRDEWVTYLPRKVFGFQTAPLVFGDIVYLGDGHHNFGYSGFWGAVGAGFRIRNDNLALGTIEFRAMYIPRRLEQDNMFKISVSANLRFKYNSNYVNMPSIINYNSDPNGDIY